MLQTRKNLTLEEFLALPEDDVTYEFVDGEVISKMTPKKFHSRLTRVLLQLLYEWCAQRGEVCPELAIKLTRRGRDWVPIPELLYISAERFPPDWEEEGACSVPPELVVEIISPGQTFGQLAAKARDYLDAGVLRVWVVDSQARSITVFYPDAPPQTYMGSTPLIDALFAGLEITAEQVFQLAKIPQSK
ncbi:Uma2 family endonuclease [Floridanema aerugineum]|jgi:Uma2 family endonuclease|uniref:Uma2 family endonuclease n=1 Tax=Floridaenema aerugineum BLCC-F46 TaxID=3153654 RepID=A0ABV4WY55_9CYAN